MTQKTSLFLLAAFKRMCTHSARLLRSKQTKNSFAAFLFLAHATINSVHIAPGASSDPDDSFDTAVTSAAFHPPTATWVLGSNKGTDPKTLLRVTLDTASDPFNFSGFTALGGGKTPPDGPSAGYIQNICFGTPLDNPQRPFIIYTSVGGTPVEKPTTGTVILPTKLYSTSFDGIVQSGSVVDNSAITDLQDFVGTVTLKICAVTAGSTYVFALVKDGTAASTRDFGDDTNDGVALMLLDEFTGKLKLQDAVNASATKNKAQQLNKTLVALNAGTDNPTIAESDLPACCYWDERLQRLYVGLPSIATNIITNSIAIAVAIAQVTTSNIINFLLPVSNYAAFNDTTRIVASKNTDTTAKTVGILKIGVMHTSTGFSYLIVNGGNKEDAGKSTLQRRIHAIPLFYSLIPADASKIGTFAKNDLTSVDFSVQASTAGDLVSLTSPEGLVGAGLLPIASTSVVTTMQIFNDTVFVGTATTTNVTDTEAPGIYYSQAIFNHLGKIVRWTDWTLAAPFAVGNSETDGSTAFMAVNGLTGHIMAVNSTTQTVVKTTNWSNEKNRGNGANPTQSLFTRLNADLSGGCFSHYDLSQSAPVYGRHTSFPIGGINYPPARLSLFGGTKGKVIFARTSYVKDTTTGTGAPNYFYNDPAGTTAYVQPQTPTTNYYFSSSGAEINYMATTITNDLTPVTTLGFTHDAATATQDTANGFFLAGTQKGKLYAWANTATGAGATPCGVNGFYFLNTTVTGFTNNPLSKTNFSWQEVSSVSGIPKKIVSLGNSTYVLTRSTQQSGTILDRVYRLPLATTVATLSSGAVLIATSSTSSLSTASAFLDITIIATQTADPTQQEQLVIATDNGLFKTTRTGGVQAATSQTDASWAAVTTPTTAGSLFNHFFSSNRTRNPESFVVMRVQDGVEFGTTLQYTDILQLCFASDTTTQASLPAAEFTSTNTKIFPYLSPIQHYWSDGARRFYIGLPQNSTSSTNGLFQLPFNVGTKTVVYNTDWYASREIRPLQHYLHDKLKLFWIAMIGDSGVVMAGTSTGVIALE